MMSVIDQSYMLPCYCTGTLEAPNMHITKYAGNSSFNNPSILSCSLSSTSILARIVTYLDKSGSLIGNVYNNYKIIYIIVTSWIYYIYNLYHMCQFDY